MGRGISQDYTEAFKWFSKVAKQGDAEAQYHLGLMFANGEGVTEDDAKAVYWHTQAAKQGDAKA